jgi:pullulanase/glycogen debranching enzyme
MNDDKRKMHSGKVVKRMLRDKARFGVLAGLMTLLPSTVAAQTSENQTGEGGSFRFTEMDCQPEQTTFRLLAPWTAKGVKVRIYSSGQGGKALKTVNMKRTEEKDVWAATVKGNLMGRYYTFDTGKGETPGVFAKAVGVNGQRAAIVNMVNTDPDDWCCDRHPVIKSPADLVVYELHHRDFSVGRSEAKHPGKFLALTEPWAIDHLKQLGVNAVHILPSYDYGSVDETRLDQPQYNWGYDPVNYNVPEGGYSTDPYDPTARIREFKQMVQALHNAGIAVILDVVYNHTYDIDHSNFQRTYPDYYYRKNADGTYSNGSGCGNETASERKMMRRFMVESVKYWYNEYRVDGFRFDVFNLLSKVYPLQDDKHPLKFQKGTQYFVDGPRMHEFLKELNDRALSLYDTYTVGESYAPDEEHARRYVMEESGELDSIFDFEHMMSDNVGGTKFIPKPFSLRKFKKGLIGPLFSTGLYFLLFNGLLTLLLGWLEKRMDYFRA